MNSTNIQSTINELAALGDKSKKLEKALNNYLKNINKRAKQEKDSINAILSILTGKSGSSSKKDEIPKEKAIKLTDEEILVKLREILSGDKKLPQSTILSQIAIRYSRFKKFLQNYPVLGHEGKNKTSLWFLK
jgi:hypothetical protein